MELEQFPLSMCIATIYRIVAFYMVHIVATAGYEMTGEDFSEQHRNGSERVYRQRA